MYPARFLLCWLALSFTVAVHAEDKPDPAIEAIVKHFAKHGFKMEKDKEYWGWIVTDPKFPGYYIIVNFKSFYTNATEEEMNKKLAQINLAHLLNAKAHLAMSIPGLRGDKPGEIKEKAPDLKKLGIEDKMIKIFKDYRRSKE